MRGTVTLLAVVMCLAGCAFQRQGNVANVPPDVGQKIAAVTVRQLVAVFPPGRTQFAIETGGNDPFGATLVQMLRRRGYGMRDGKGEPADRALSLSYIVDSPIAKDQYRVTVAAGGQSLTRFFVVDRGNVVPASPWALREQ